MRALCQSNHSNLLSFSLQSPGLFPPQTVFPSLPPSLPHRISGKARIWQKVTTVAIFPKSTRWRVSMRKVPKCEGPLQKLAISSNGAKWTQLVLPPFKLNGSGRAFPISGSNGAWVWVWVVCLACGTGPSDAAPESHLLGTCNMTSPSSTSPSGYSRIRTLRTKTKNSVMTK